MNTKAVFSLVALIATSENTAYGVYSVKKKKNLTPKKSNILYLIKAMQKVLLKSWQVNANLHGLVSLRMESKPLLFDSNAGTVLKYKHCSLAPLSRGRGGGMRALLQMIGA